MCMLNFRWKDAASPSDDVVRTLSMRRKKRSETKMGDDRIMRTGYQRQLANRH
jgi:hypothetical protein